MPRILTSSRTIVAQTMLRVASHLETEHDFLNSDLTFRMAQILMEEEPPKEGQDLQSLYNRGKHETLSLDDAAKRVMDNGGFRQNAGGSQNNAPQMTKEEMEHLIRTDPRIPKDEHGRMIQQGLKVRHPGGEAKFLSIQRLQQLMRDHKHEDDGMAGHHAPEIALK